MTRGPDAHEPSSDWFRPLLLVVVSLTLVNLMVFISIYLGRAS